MLPSRDVAAVARHLGLDAGRRRARPGAAVPGDPPLARDLVERHGRRIAGKALDRRGELLQSFRSRVAEGLLGAGVEAWDVARVARDVPLALGVRDVRLERRPLLAPDAHPRVRMIRAERPSAKQSVSRTRSDFVRYCLLLLAVARSRRVVSALAPYVSPCMCCWPGKKPPARRRSQRGAPVSPEQQPDRGHRQM